MRIALIFNALRPDTTGIYFERACRGLGLEVRRWPLDAIEEVPSGYDLYLRIDHGDDYEVRPPARLRPVVFYAIDTHLSHSWKKIRRIAPAYDRVFCAHRQGAERLRDASWLPVACDPELHGAAVVEDDAPQDYSRPPSVRPSCVADDPAAWDLAFVGTDCGVPRKFYLQALRERYPNSRIGVAAHTKIASIYRRSRIGFNYSIRREVNMRVFEVLAAKTLLITNALPEDDFDRLGFHERCELITYRRPGELLERIDEMLSRPEERRRIAAAGHEVVMARHTYRHRVRQMLSELGFSIPGRHVSSFEFRVSSSDISGAGHLKPGT